MRIKASQAKKLAEIGSGRTFDALDYICAKIELHAKFGDNSLELKGDIDYDTWDSLEALGYMVFRDFEDNYVITWR